MSFAITSPEGRSFVRVRLMSPMTRDLALRLAVEVSNEARGAGRHATLYDLRAARNVEGTLANYRFAYEDLGSLPIEKDARVALLVAAGDNSHDFVETVSRNAGYDVRIFSDEATAVLWLEAQGYALPVPPTR